MLLLLASGCAEVGEGTTEQGLTQAQRIQRAALIRDSAAEMGLFNAALLGGIAISETNLAHCASELSFGCPGPASPSCGGEPIIAGGADGPCADMQGGLGMFQFDAGTYAQTLAAYGPSILTVEGNTAQAVSFVAERLDQSITGVDGWLSAMSWMNNVPLVAGDPMSDQWGQFLACRYNGCCSGSATCRSRGDAYRDNAIDIYAEMGPEFWRTADRCTALPADGIIEQRSPCYVAAGDPRFWRREAVGHGDTSEWTNTTANAAAKNFAQWLIHVPAGRYRVEAYVTGGAATTAAYEIAHAGASDTIVVDQSTADGWVVLAEEVAFSGEGDEHVALGDNTGTAGQRLAFDAVRVTSLDGPPPDDMGDGSDGGCAAGGPGAGLGVLGALALLGRRRRNRPAAAPGN